MGRVDVAAPRALDDFMFVLRHSRSIAPLALHFSSRQTWLLKPEEQPSLQATHIPSPVSAAHLSGARTFIQPIRCETVCAEGLV